MLDAGVCVARAVDENGCFPAAASVTVEGRGAVRMDSLQYGDKVLAVDTTTGNFVYRPVFLFGHRQQTGKYAYVNIGTDSGAALQLTSNHFVPVRVSQSGTGSSVIYKVARDVRVGDLVMVVAGNGTSAFSGTAALEPATVTEVWVSRETGLITPYIRGADIIVDGVVASPHPAAWGLDTVLPASVLPYLPAVMEVLFAPIYGLTLVLGPKWSEWVAHEGLGLVEAGRDNAGVFFGVVGAVSGVVPLAAWMTVSAARKALRL